MKLTQSLNRTVLVAIPAFFGDEEARACTLVDATSRDCGSRATS
jgi:hypothetical protein